MSFDSDVTRTQKYFESPRFAGITRLYSASQVAAQRGSIRNEYPIAKDAAAGFWDLLFELHAKGESITTFGPYSPGQAVAMKRQGLRGIYLGGWATSAKGSITEDPGADVAAYPLSQVPNEAAVLVRALLTADKNQAYQRSQMTPAQREVTPKVDFRPFIIADADTGHGGDAHVRNLIRRFVEAGVPGYHIEDQRPGTKKCGHQGGKVLVSCDEQIKRLNAARFQLDVMEVAGIIVARTDAEAATLLDSNADERDQPFILGTTTTDVPHYKDCTLAVLEALHDAGLDEINGFKLYERSKASSERAHKWLQRLGIIDFVQTLAAKHLADPIGPASKVVDAAATRLVECWEPAAGLKTYGEAIAEVIEFRLSEGEELAMDVAEWKAFASRVSYHEARDQARSLGIRIIWDAERARTPEGYYQIRGGIDYAIAKSLAVAPFCDILWMETKTANVADAKVFAEAIHARFPGKMLAYNLSPSFNWDTTGMNDDEMRSFPIELGKAGFVFNFITYGGHQIDGLAGEEFSLALKQDGMLALARLQRQFRLVESPYRTPQTLVGGPRLDGALAASSGRTATTKSMGKGSTQFQHLVQTEVPTRLLEEILALWTEHYQLPHRLSVRLRPHRAGSELLELAILGNEGAKLANVIFADIIDRRGDHILSVRDQNTFDESLRQKRLMSLIHFFLIKRYGSVSVHYVSPTEDNQYQTSKMQSQGIFSEVSSEVGNIIVAAVEPVRVAELLAPDRQALIRFIAKQEDPITA